MKKNLKLRIFGAFLDVLGVVLIVAFLGFAAFYVWLEVSLRLSMLGWFGGN